MVLSSFSHSDCILIMCNSYLGINLTLAVSTNLKRLFIERSEGRVSIMYILMSIEAIF